MLLHWSLISSRFFFNKLTAAVKSDITKGKNIFLKLCRRTKKCCSFPQRQNFFSFKLYHIKIEAEGNFENIQRPCQTNPLILQNTIFSNAYNTNVHYSVCDGCFLSQQKVCRLATLFCFIHCYKNLLNMFSSGLQEIISLPDRST